MINGICAEQKCTGCMSCYNTCPVDAITICTDKLGFYRPLIGEKCIECHRCQSVCPSNNLYLNQSPSLVYAAYKRNTIAKATSGGVATAIYLYYAKKKKVSLYGVVFDKNEQQFKFAKAQSEEEVLQFSGSKYVQAYVGSIYRDLKNDLEAGRECVFVGTPCQVQGLKSFLHFKEYPGLLTIDIVCHGCPSQKMLFESLGEFNKIKTISFREGSKYVLSLTYLSGKTEKITTKQSSFFEGFHSGRIFGECCHNCEYARKERTGDISLGDFWGLSDNSEIYQKKGSGISLVLINTEMGAKIFRDIQPDLVVEKRDLDEAIKGNTQLREAVKDSKYAQRFRKLYTIKTFEQSIKKSRKTKEIIKHMPWIWNIYKEI